MDPFIAFRILVTIVLSGIWLYTLIEGIIFLRITIGKRKSTEAQDWDNRTTRVNKRLARVGQKFILIKALQIFSWRTFWIQRNELTMIIALAIFNVIALYFFYTI